MIKFREFGAGLHVGGPSDSVPQNALVRAKGIAPIHDTSLVSRWGHPYIGQVTGAGETVNSLVWWNGFYWVGTNQGRLYKIESGLGTVVKAGLNGNSLSFYAASPVAGKEEVLFVAGGGLALKITQAGEVQNWHTDLPANTFVVRKGQRRIKVLEPFNNKDAYVVDARTNGIVALTNDTFAANYDETTGVSMKVVGQRVFSFNGGFAANLNTFNYQTQEGKSARWPTSSEQDYITFWLWLPSVGSKDPTTVAPAPEKTFEAEVDWLELVFMLDGNPYTPTDYYAHLFVKDETQLQDKGLLRGHVYPPKEKVFTPETGAKKIHEPVATPGRVISGSGDVIATRWYFAAIPPTNKFSLFPQTRNGWVKIELAKSQFERVGTNKKLDWSTVKGLRVFVGSSSAQAVDCQFWIDDMQLEGGYGGQGTAVCSITHLNSKTGLESNPNTSPQIVTVNREPIVFENLIAPADPQIDKIRLWVSTKHLPDSPITLEDSPRFLAAEIDVADLGLSAEPATRDSYRHARYGYTVGKGDIYQQHVPALAFAGEKLTQIETGNTISVHEDDGRLVKAGDQILVFADTDTTQATHNLADGTIKADPEERRSVVGVSENFRLITLDAAVDWRNNGNGRLWGWEPRPELLDLTQPLSFDNFGPDDSIVDLVPGPQQRLFFRSTKKEFRDLVLFSRSDNRQSLSTDGFVRLPVGTASIQKLVEFNRTVWVFTEQEICAISGEAPYVAVTVYGAPGTIWPDTVTATPRGIMYRSKDGLRIFDGQVSTLVGEQALGMVLRGKDSPTLAAFEPTVSTCNETEYVTTDGTIVLAMDLQTGAWREISNAGLVELVGTFKALAFDARNKRLLAGWGNRVAEMERPDSLLDMTATPIEFDVQTPTVRVSPAGKGFVQMLYVDANVGVQKVEVWGVLDSEEVLLGVLNGHAYRSVTEFPVNRWTERFGVRLKGDLTDGADVYGIEVQVRPTTSQE